MSKTREYTIQTAGDTWTVRSRGMWQALKKAWQQRPPESVGALVQFDAPGMDTSYCLGHVALQRAGFKCPDISEEEYIATGKVEGE